MKSREQYDEVCSSLRNGQRQQAYRQMMEINADDLPGMFDYFASDLADADLVLDAARTFTRYLTR